MPVRITIVFDNLHTTRYHAGDTISGNVVVITKKEEETKGINIKLVGGAFVDWIENDRRFTDSEKFVEFEETLLLADKNNPDTLPAGESTHSFEFKLPDKRLPASYTGAHGKVEYNVEATCDGVKSRKVFHVEGVVCIPESEPEGDRHKSKMMSSQGFFCSFGTLSLKMTSKGTNFLCGQRIPLQVYVNNLSKRRVDDVLVTLVEQTDYKAGASKCRTKKVILEVKRGQAINCGEDDLWQTEIEVPSQLSPTGLGGRGKLIIDVNYLLKAETLGKLSKSRVEVTSAICIGNIVNSYQCSKDYIESLVLN